MLPGPDPDFPYLNEYERYAFPDPDKSQNDSIIIFGGNLSPGMLLSAYEQGLFPWYNYDQPVIWHSPDPRFILFPENLHIPNSLKKLLKHNKYKITFNVDFENVIANCSKIYRPNQSGTWITSDMVKAYTEMHRLGWAVSAEAWEGNELAGGCYGLLFTNIFFGESMFAKKPNASKAAFAVLAKSLFNAGIVFIDCQTYTNHLERFGAKMISRSDYLRLLKENITQNRSR